MLFSGNRVGIGPDGSFNESASSGGSCALAIRDDVEGERESRSGEGRKAKTHFHSSQNLR